VTLRTKIVAALVLLATSATIAIGVFSYTATANQLLSEIDRSLDQGAKEIVRRAKVYEPGPGPRIDVGLVELQVLRPDGSIAGATSSVELPVSDLDREIASSSVPRSTRTTTSVDGTRYRVETLSLGRGGGAIQLARTLEEYDNVLASLRNRVLVAGALVIVGAAAIGWLLARQLTRRLTRLSKAAEEVTETGRLDVQVPVEADDEAGRLGVAFNEMLAALARSKEEQQRLVQDAGHELRTPLTSLRTNMSVLRRHELEPDARAQVLDDLDSEARELTDLVNELVELATDRSRDEPEQDVDLGQVAGHVAQRAQRRTGRVVSVDSDGAVVRGRPHGLERAISNLVDNALKFDGGTGPIEVVVRGGTVTVLDRGPGIDEADRPYVFDRFFRSVNARSRPGSGLGLSIVRQVAVRHDGTVFVHARDGGGTAIGFTVGGATPAAAPTAAAASTGAPASSPATAARPPVVPPPGATPPYAPPAPPVAPGE
jgi:two-component system sensor histidine kinase MprB